MSETRGTILEALKNALKGITKANGYLSDVVFVSRKWVAWETLTSDQFPALMVIDDGSEEIEDDAHEWVIANMSPTIVGYVKGDDVSSEFSKLESDLKKFIYSKPDLGDNAKVFIYDGMVVFTMDDLIYFQMSVTITYDFQKSSP